MLIRKMFPNDIAQVHQIEEKVQLHPWTYGQFSSSVDSYQCTVLLDGDRVFGFCIMQPVLDEANLLLMAIDPIEQGKGYGAKLLDDAIRRLGSSCVQIFLEVRESNLAAIALYEKLNFHQIDIRKNYYPLPHGKKENAIIMVKVLKEESFGFQL